MSLYKRRHLPLLCASRLPRSGTHPHPPLLPRAAPLAETLGGVGYVSNLASVKLVAHEVFLTVALSLSEEVPERVILKISVLVALATLVGGFPDPT